ncbi:hypothetical protein [Nocardioides panacihumi]|uniref:hypothetical protein n=1 Tax=Nocardioides panacihumi TaxID=400774 RepID=UPI0031D47834
MDPRPPIIDPDVAPRDAIHVALTWLAEIYEGATVIRSKQALRWTRGTAQLELHFQSSTYSRREIGAWAHLRVQVLDPGFGRWRARNPNLTWRTGPLVHSSGTLPPSVVLYGDGAGSRRLDDLPAFIGTDVLPLLETFASPARLASDYDLGAMSVFSCIEWSAYKDDIDAARLLLTRHVDGAHPALRARLDQARAAGLPAPGTPIANDIDWWGPTLERLGILAPGEPLPGTAGPDVAIRNESSRIAAILSEFGHVVDVQAD